MGKVINHLNGLSANLITHFLQKHIKFIAFLMPKLLRDLGIFFSQPSQMLYNKANSSPT